MKPFFSLSRGVLVFGSWIGATGALCGADSPTLAVLRASEVKMVSTTYKGGDPRIPEQPGGLKFVFTVVSGEVTRTVETDGPVVKVTGPDGTVVSFSGSEIAVSNRAAGAPAAPSVVMGDPALARLVSEAAIAAIAATASIEGKPHPLQREFGPAEENARVAAPLLSLVRTLGVALPDLVEATTTVAGQHATGIVAAAVGAALASGQSPAEAGGGMVARVLRGLGRFDPEVANAAARAAIFGQTDLTVQQGVFVSVVRATLAASGIATESLMSPIPQIAQSAEQMIAQVVGRTMAAVSPGGVLPNLASLLRSALDGAVAATNPAVNGAVVVTTSSVAPLVNTTQISQAITRITEGVVAGIFNGPPPLAPPAPGPPQSVQTTPVTPIDPSINVSPSGG